MRESFTAEGSLIEIQDGRYKIPYSESYDTQKAQEFHSYLKLTETHICSSNFRFVSRNLLLKKEIFQK